MTPPPGMELPPEILAGAQSDSINRRGSDRKSYRVLQGVAPCPNGRLPDSSMFHQVHCYDISRGGISFYTSQPLLDEYVVVALRNGPRAIYVKARVANCIRVSDGHGATFRVGCEFVVRVEIHPR
jgi:PilZ domain-containing protein